MAEPDIEQTSRFVRVFPGYAGTVLWASSGLIEYEESRLSTDLVTALAAWESEWETAALAGAPLAGEGERLWFAEGKRLAEAVAAELGFGFAVEVEDATVTITVQSRKLPTNPEAAAVFEAHRVAFVAETRARDEWLGAMTPEQRASLRYEPLRGRDLS